jgi:hypothetical protein
VGAGPLGRLAARRHPKLAASTSSRLPQAEPPSLQRAQRGRDFPEATVLVPSNGRRCRGSPFGKGLELRLGLLLPSCPPSAIMCDCNPLPSEIKVLFL